MCCFLFSGEPVDGDPRKNGENAFAVNMMEAPRADPLCTCVYHFVCACRNEHKLFD